MLHSKINFLQTHLLALKSLYESCNRHTLSHLAVPTSELRRILQRQAEALNTAGQEFVYSSPEWYYKVEKTTCVLIDDRTLRIVFQAPVRDVGTDFRVMSLSPLQFVYDSLRCKLVSDKVYFAIHGQEVLSLDRLEPFGNPSTYVLPRHVSPGNIPDCVLALLHEDQLSVLASACPLHCSPANQTVIEPLTDHVYSVLNPTADLNIVCAGILSKKLVKLTHGRYEVEMPCNCNLQADGGRVLIKGLANCNARAPAAVRVSTAWAEKEFSLPPVFLTSNVTDDLPLNVTMPELVIITPPSLEMPTWTDMDLYKSGKVETVLFSLLSLTTLAGLAYWAGPRLGCSAISSALALLTGGLPCCRAGRTQTQPPQDEEAARAPTPEAHGAPAGDIPLRPLDKAPRPTPRDNAHGPAPFLSAERMFSGRPRPGTTNWDIDALLADAAATLRHPLTGPGRTPSPTERMSLPYDK